LNAQTRSFSQEVIMTNASVSIERPGRSVRRERLARLFGDNSTTTTPKPSPAEPASPRFTDPVFASAARDALSADSATFLRQARQIRGE